MCQIVIQGIEAIHEIVNHNKILLVVDDAYKHLYIKEVFDRYQHEEFSEITSNPLYEQVCNGVKVFNDTKCNMIVAIGGGSTIDVAKCIKLFCKMNNQENFLKQEKSDTKIPLVAIPTTAGTGSESTKYAVIYYNGEKQSISHESIVPDYAILESKLLFTLPEYQRKCTVLDALCQAIESWWSINSTDESKRYSQYAIQKIMNYWKAYLNNSEVAAKEIMLAANYAGRAINITATTAAHAMSYKITSLYSIPHGHAVAMCMKEVWKYMNNHMEKCIDRRGKEYLSNVMKEIESTIDYMSFCKIYEEMCMYMPQSDNREKELELLTKSVNELRLKNHPIKLNQEDLYNLYERIVG